jgi:nitrate/nitrite transporter NarK
VHNIGRRRAWVIWGVGMAVYVLAIFYRTSLGVAGILAAERFQINASQLATFTVLQLSVYAAMQVPVGIWLDRYGAKRLLTVGAILMTAGMAWFATADSYAAGLAARTLVGMGDAMIFSSVIRLVAFWFTVKQAPFVTQMTGFIGQLGAIAAATPLSVALHAFGWERSFGLAAVLGVAAAVPMVLLVKDSPYRGEPVEKIKVRALVRTMRELWGNPGTQVALYSHFTLPFAPQVFGLLWGYPFLVLGQGMSPSGAANMLMLMTGTAIVAGPIIARFTAINPWHRSSLVLAIVAVIAGAWAVLLLWPGRAPLWLLVVVVIITATGGPGSMVSFDMARTFHPPERLSRASGIVNVGGFVAALITMAMIGVVLDWLKPGGPSTYTLADFRIALSVQFAVWGFGALQIWRFRRRGRRMLARTPGAVEALRDGSSLVPGHSLPPLPRTRTINEPRQGD